MRSYSRLIAAAMFALGGLGLVSADARAQGLVTVIHGINGTDLGAAEEFPVDIAVDGACALTAVPFRAIARDVELDTGIHEIEVFLNDPNAGNCGGALAVTSRIDLAVGENATVIAHLNQSAAPSLTKVSNNAGALGDSSARLAVVHAAVAPPVDISAYRRNGGGSVRIDGLANGEQSFPQDVRSGSYKVRISPDTSFRPLVKTRVFLDDGVSYTVFAVGTLAKGSFELITLDITP